MPWNCKLSLNCHCCLARKTCDSVNVCLNQVCLIITPETSRPAPLGDKMYPSQNPVFPDSLLSHTSVLYQRISSDFFSTHLVCQSCVMKPPWTCQPQLTRWNSLCICCILLGNLGASVYSAQIHYFHASKKNQNVFMQYFHSYYGLNYRLQFFKSWLM